MPLVALVVNVCICIYICERLSSSRRSTMSYSISESVSVLGEAAGLLVDFEENDRRPLALVESVLLPRKRD